jgi:hypothetical protein
MVKILGTKFVLVPAFMCILIGIILLGVGGSEASDNKMPQMRDEFLASGLVLLFLGIILCFFCRRSFYINSTSRLRASL